jgi:hypothetical protein
LYNNIHIGIPAQKQDYIISTTCLKLKYYRAIMAFQKIGGKITGLKSLSLLKKNG